MKLIIYTAAFGETDRVQAPWVVDPSAEYLCFTDGPPAPAPYRTVRIERPLRPQLAARRVKIVADHPALERADALLWHDSSFRLLRDGGWARRTLARADLVAMRHARRDRLEDEGFAIARYGYVTSDEAVAHVSRYRGEGFNLEGLSSSGLMAFRASPAVRQFRALWWAETQRWGGRDQGSLDYCAWSAGCRIAYIKGNHRSNPYAAWRTAPPEVVS